MASADSTEVPPNFMTIIRSVLRGVHTSVNAARRSACATISHDNHVAHALLRAASPLLATLGLSVENMHHISQAVLPNTSTPHLELLRRRPRESYCVPARRIYSPTPGTHACVPQIRPCRARAQHPCVVGDG